MYCIVMYKYYYFVFRFLKCKLYYEICLFYTDCGNWWFELDRDSCWNFISKEVEYNVAKENCENNFLGKIIALDENIPDTLKNVYDSDTIPAWVTNKVNFCLTRFRF